jgi:hypothetical protein
VDVPVRCWSRFRCAMTAGSKHLEVGEVLVHVTEGQNQCFGAAFAPDRPVTRDVYGRSPSLWVVVLLGRIRIDSNSMY